MLARALGGSYFDLEQEPERLRLDLGWERHVSGRELVVLDEAQTWPELFDRLRGAIDADRTRMGRFLLLGSVSPSLMTHVSESLAGRLSLVELTPLLWTELESRASRERLWLCGGFPDGGVLKRGRYPQWQRDYLTLLVQRDLPTWGLPATPRTTDRLLRMTAALHGSMWNASKLGKSLGLSYHTVNRYADFLWRDTGLLHALLGAPDEESLLAQPWVGASWEGHVIEHAIGALEARGTPFEAFHFRTSDQHEIDLVLELAGGRWAIGVRLTSAPTTDDLRALDRRADLIGASRRLLVSHTREPAGNERRASCDLAGLLERLAAV